MMCHGMVTRDSHVRHTTCHKGCHKTPTRPDPTRPISYGWLGLSGVLSQVQIVKAVEGQRRDGLVL